MTGDAKLKIIHNALYHLGLLQTGEVPSVADARYLEVELDAILASLHLILAQRVALQYKVQPPSPIIAAESAVIPRAGDKEAL